MSSRPNGTRAGSGGNPVYQEISLFQSSRLKASISSRLHIWIASRYLFGKKHSYQNRKRLEFSSEWVCRWDHPLHDVLLFFVMGESSWFKRYEAGHRPVQTLRTVNSWEHQNPPHSRGCGNPVYQEIPLKKRACWQDHAAHNVSNQFRQKQLTNILIGGRRFPNTFCKIF